MYDQWMQKVIYQNTKNIETKDHRNPYMEIEEVSHWDEEVYIERMTF